MAYGTVNADVIGTSVAGSNIGAGNASIMKNRIINGAMVIDQRNAGASVTITSNQFGVDRMSYEVSQASKLSAQQNAGSVTPPVGFTNYQGTTSLSAYSSTSTDYFWVRQNIEGYNIADLNWGTANAKTVTVSFWAYSSLTGSFSATLVNDGNNRCFPFSYSIPVANTWTFITQTVTGDTTGTWATNNATGIRLIWNLGTGSSRQTTGGAWVAGDYRGGVTGSVSVVGTNGATFYITGVQLEVGSFATGYEYRQYQQELALCQRYLPAILGNNNPSYINYSSATGGNIYITYPVTPRTAPTGVSYSSLSHFNMFGSLGSNAPTTISFQLGGTSSISLNVSGAGNIGVSGQTGAFLSTSASAQILLTGCEL